MCGLLLKGDILKKTTMEFAKGRSFAILIFQGFISHPVGTSINSNWFVNSFIIVVNENFFLFCQNFVSEGRLKNFLIDNYNKTIYEPVIHFQNKYLRFNLFHRNKLIQNEKHYMIEFTLKESTDAFDSSFSIFSCCSSLLTLISSWDCFLGSCQ